MDKKFIIEVHFGDDYVEFTVGKKSKIWRTEGKNMYKLLLKFIHNLTH